MTKVNRYLTCFFMLCACSTDATGFMAEEDADAGIVFAEDASYIEEDAEGRDVVTYDCPQCGKETRSLRFT